MSWEYVRPEARLWTGDALAGLQTLPDASVQCCVTSPPYYGLRDYGTATWEGGDPACEHKVREHAGIESSGLGGGKSTVGHAKEGFRKYCPRCGAVRVDDQIGMEETPDAYVDRLVEVFREVRRVLRDDGTVWLNLGDSYAGGGGFSPNDPSNLAGAKQTTQKGAKEGGIKPQGIIKPKDLVGIPWMVAFALRADGWYLRQDILWAKKNCMPESVTDRCTKAHEYVFLLTKRARYFFDADAIREPVTYFVSDASKISGEYSSGSGRNDSSPHRSGGFVSKQDMRNKRSVWTLASEPCAEAHFATMPSALAELCIRAGTPVHGCCAACGTPYVSEFQERESDGLVDYEGKWGEEDQQSSGRRLLARARAARMAGKGHDAPFAGRVVTGYKQSCACANAGTVPSTVFDPFTGSGTTGIVALRQDRRFVGCELNQEYAAMAARRIAAVGIQLSLL